MEFLFLLAAYFVGSVALGFTLVGIVMAVRWVARGFGRSFDHEMPDRIRRLNFR